MIRKRIVSPFLEFLKTEQSSGVILIACTIISLLIANSWFSPQYLAFWYTAIGFEGFGLHLKESILHWINDGLMAVFFLVAGMEIKRELLTGELSTPRRAALPLIAAVGGMMIPAVIYVIFNSGTKTSAGWGIPMATDIAFALGALSLLGQRVPVSLKIFLTALAVIDDLGAIIVIGIFYSSGIVLSNLSIALALFILLHILNRLGVVNLLFYLLIGLIMWYFMLRSGVHATIAGVLLATAIPLRSTKKDYSPLEFLEHRLHKFSGYIIMPLFALANTAIIFSPSNSEIFSSSLSIGVILGLLLGKPVGIAGFSYLAVGLGIAQMPSKVNARKMIGIGLLGGIGFTMSIFISVLAFDDPSVQDMAKVSVLIASVLSGFAGYLVLKSGTNEKEEILL